MLLREYDIKALHPLKIGPFISDGNQENLSERIGGDIATIMVLIGDINEKIARLNLVLYKLLASCGNWI